MRPVSFDYALRIIYFMDTHPPVPSLVREDRGVSTEDGMFIL